MGTLCASEKWEKNGIENITARRTQNLQEAPIFFFRAAVTRRNQETPKLKSAHPSHAAICFVTHSEISFNYSLSSLLIHKQGSKQLLLPAHKVVKALS